jgi:simple sugar transport system ATP-binding protein
MMVRSRGEVRRAAAPPLAMTDPDLNPPALRLRDVSKRFGGVMALDGLDFDVGAGEVHCLAGENGCGKSTLIKIVTGVHPPEPGAVLEIFGTRYETMTPTRSRSLGIAVIWQDLALFPHMSIAENIGFDAMVGSWPRPTRARALRRRAREVLDRLGVRLDLDAPLHTLAIAERQIVAIARALMGEARLIFMDEPTASLTQSETDALLKVVRALSADGVAIVFVSHRLAEVLEIASRVTVVRDGRLVGVYPTRGMTQARLGELMTGQNLSAEVGARDMADAPPVLEVHNLTRRGAFEDVTLTVRAGEVVGLTGLIGAGRTELAHALIGMLPPDAGVIRMEGRTIRPRSIRAAMKAGIAYVSEDRLTLGLIQPQSIADNTVISVLPKIERGPLISPARKDALTRLWIEELAVKIDRPEDPISTLSGGNQQRVVLAKWLATEPRLLILDSPTVGVDVGARAGIFRIVRRLAEAGLAILLISDEVTEVLHHADRVLHMAAGRIVSEHDPRETDIAALEAAIYA